MFGYIKAYKPDMTFSQYDIYKGIYCSLCKTIGKNYGFFARMTLSYDFAFFALVRLSVEKSCPGFQNSHCSFNPTKKCLECSADNPDLKFSADISMLMVYYKYLDNLQDYKGVKRFALRLLSPYFNYIGRKAKKHCPEGDNILSQMHKLQSETEAHFNGNIDEACHPSADALGKLLALNKTSQKGLLYDFGYLIGRWVYLIDALDDCEKDKTNGNFNPFVYNNLDENDAIPSLNLTVARAIDLFQNLEVLRYKSIITNILYDGLSASVRTVTERRNNEKSL